MMTEGKSAKCWRRHSLYWRPQQLPLQATNAKVSVLSSQTSCEIIYRASNIIFAADQRQFDFLYPVPSIPGSLSHHSFLCCWFKRRNSEWSDVPFSCVSLIYKSSDIKSTVGYIFCFIAPTHWLNVQNSVLCTYTQFLTCMCSFTASATAWHISGKISLFIQEFGKHIADLSCDIPVVLDIIWRYRCSTVEHN